MVGRLLKGYQGTVLLISHDRYFLDKIVTKVIEVENKKSSVYEGNYTFYSKQKDINRQIQQKAYEVQQKRLNIKKMSLKHCGHLIEKSPLKGQKVEKRH